MSRHHGPSLSRVEGHEAPGAGSEFSFPADESLPRAVPCRDHSFDESLVCRCGVSWWTHQRTQAPCPLNARGRNRGEGTARANGRGRADEVETADA